MTTATEPEFRVFLACCQSVILNEIKQGLNQTQIAQTYRMTMEAVNYNGEVVDWIVINTAISERWSPKGLERVKTMAWSGKCFEKKGAKK